MVRVIAGTVLIVALVSARAAADALPHDPATGKSIDGAAVLQGLDQHPNFTFVILDGGCFSDAFEDDDQERLRRKLGDERGSCGYRIVESGVAYKGVSQDAPNAGSDEFFALPAERFPVEDGKVPALDRLPFATLLAWQAGELDSPLKALGSPPGFIELHRFSERVGFTDHLRVRSPCGAPVLELVRRDWRLANGDVITQSQPIIPPDCDPAPAVPEDMLERPDAVAPVAVAEPAVAPVVVAPVAPVVVAASPGSGSAQAPTVRPVGSSADLVDMSEETSGSRLGARELVLGGVCLLVGLGSGVALRRRPAR